MNQERQKGREEKDGAVNRRVTRRCANPPLMVVLESVFKPNVQMHEKERGMFVSYCLLEGKSISVTGGAACTFGVGKLASSPSPSTVYKIIKV